MDLPADHRIVEHGSVASAEHQADRYVSAKLLWCVLGGLM